MGYLGNLYNSVAYVSDPRNLYSVGKGIYDHGGAAYREMKRNGFAGDGSQETKDKLLSHEGAKASGFANVGEVGYSRLSAEGQEARGFLRDQAMGKNSLSAEQLRQGLQQQQAQMQSMAQGGPASSAPMNARTAMIQAGRASSGMAGNAAMAGVAERNAAQQAWANAIGQARGQDMQVALDSRRNAMTAYGAKPEEKGWWDKYGGAVMGAATIAAM